MAIARWGPSGQGLVLRPTMDRLLAESSARRMSALSVLVRARPGASPLDLHAEDEPETRGGAGASTGAGGPDADQTDTGETATQGTQPGEGVTTRTGSSE